MDCKEQIIIIGDLAFDVKKQKKLEITSIGGGAYNCLVAAAKFSNKVGVVAPVGEDFPLERLTRYGVDLQGVKVIPGEDTARFTLEITKQNERIVTASVGLLAQAYTHLFPPQYREAVTIHLSTSHPQKYLSWLEYLRPRVSKNTRISVDAFEMYAQQFPHLTLQACAQADMVFLNESELNLLGEDAVMALPVPLVLKRGAAGVVYLENGSVIEVPAPAVEVKDTTGAGDVLAGAFLALLSQGIPVETALSQAVQLASLSVSEPGVEHIF